VQLSFSSVSNPFELELRHREDNGAYIIVSVARWSIIEETTSSLDLTLQISRNLIAGDYELHILQQTPSFIPLNNNDLCFPYAWSLQLIPTGGIHPFVSYVEPPEAVNLSPKKNLYIEIGLSEPPFDFNRNSITRAYGQDTINSTFYLQAGTENPIYSSAIGGQFYPPNDDYTIWHFTFSHESLQLGKTYNFKLFPNKIFNVQHQSLVMYGLHSYTTRQHDCVYGTYNEQTKQCNCFIGYTGSECTFCQDGYEMYSGQCFKAGQCHYDTCGCQPNFDGCVPAGKCTPQEGGQPTCGCYQGFSGTHCKCPFDCGSHGVCDEHIARCSCQPGWSGDNCTTSTMQPTSPPPTLRPTTGNPTESTPTSSCLHNCYNRGTCNELTGLCTCDQGWKGNDCSQQSTPSAPSSSNKKFLLFIGIGGGACVVIIAVVVVVWWWRKRKKVEELDWQPLDESLKFEPHGL